MTHRLFLSLSSEAWFSSYELDFFRASSPRCLLDLEMESLMATLPSVRRLARLNFDVLRLHPTLIVVQSFFPSPRSIWCAMICHSFEEIHVGYLPLRSENMCILENLLSYFGSSWTFLLIKELFCLRLHLLLILCHVSCCTIHALMHDPMTDVCDRTDWPVDDFCLLFWVFFRTVSIFLCSESPLLNYARSPCSTSFFCTSTICFTKSVVSSSDSRAVESESIASCETVRVHRESSFSWLRIGDPGLVMNVSF